MVNYADIDKPVTAEQPCGPDPDLDLEIQNFLPVAEGRLPASYRDFNRKTFEANPALQALQTYLGRSRDIRFLVLAAKYHILSDDLAGFAEAVTAMHTLLSGQWEHCHPTATAGGNELRAAYLKSLDDLPTSVFPLQSATLLNEKRLGAISMRSILIASKQLAARAGETVPEGGAIHDAFMRIEPVEQLIGLRKSVDAIAASLAGIRQLFIDQAGYETAPQFDQLPALVTAISAYLSEVLRARVPREAAAAESAEVEAAGSERGAAAAVAAPSQEIASVGEASAALLAILVYYAVNEPSSPSRLLLKQAHQLVGKSFVEAMKILAPAVAEKAKIPFGGDAPFALTFAQLAALPADDAKPRDAKAETEARTFNAATRAEASVLMGQVERYFRNTEPSSPIPMLVERARNFVAKGFAELLKEMAKKDEKS